jgi:hypothetical protein
MSGELLTPTQKRISTQWAAQFLAASELTRRGHSVAFTMGNHSPDADLMVRSPGNSMFLVDVKGQSGKGAWLVKPKTTSAPLFYVLVYLSPLQEGGLSHQQDQFFVLRWEEAAQLAKEYAETHPNDKGIFPGFGRTDALKFQNKWDKLPP